MDSPDLPGIGIAWCPVPSGHYTPGDRGDIRVIVIHSTDNTASATQELQYARRPFGPDHPEVSWHFCIDDDSIIQSVAIRNTAWSAYPTGNRIGVHIEVCGLSKWTRAEWLQHTRRLEKTRLLVQTLCARLGVPDQRLTTADLAIGKRGVCSHAAVSAVWHESDHTDPGPGFPWDYVVTGASVPDNGGNTSTFSVEGVVSRFPYVKNGDRGRAVRIVQGLCNAWGIVIAVDGIWGRQTETAVLRFQTTHGLKDDGIVGPLTMGAFLSVV